MIIKLPVEIVDAFTTLNLQGAGYTRMIQAGIIQYTHVKEGQISLRKLDNCSTEIIFSYPIYPQVFDILPLHHATKMLTAKVVSGEEYPEDVVQMLADEYNQRIAAKQSLINFYVNKIKQEEIRVRDLAVRDSEDEVHETNPPAADQDPAPAEQVNRPSLKPGYDELSEEERLCLEWAARDSSPRLTMEEFLSEKGLDDYNSHKYISKEQFKSMLQQAGEKGILEKVNGRWKPALEYALRADRAH